MIEVELHRVLIPDPSAHPSPTTAITTDTFKAAMFTEYLLGGEADSILKAAASKAIRTPGVRLPLELVAMALERLLDDRAEQDMPTKGTLQ